MDRLPVLYGVVGYNNRFLLHISLLQGIHTPIDTVADAAAALRLMHEMLCSCEEGSSFAEHVWLTTMPPGIESNVALQDYFPREEERVPSEAALADLLAGELRPRTVVMFGNNSDALARCARFEGVGRLGGDVCRVAYRPIPSLPVTSNFEILLSTPGTCYVDVAERIEHWDFCSRQKMPIIRRPPGYGMTTFLSMCATTFTRREGNSTLPFLRVRDQWAPSWRGPRPVLSLDFAELDFCANLSDADGGGMLPSRDEMVSRADAYMRATASAFCARYLPQREPAYDYDPFFPSHGAITAVSRQLGAQVF